MRWNQIFGSQESYIFPMTSFGEMEYKRTTPALKVSAGMTKLEFRNPRLWDDEM